MAGESVGPNVDVAGPSSYERSYRLATYSRLQSLEPPGSSSSSSAQAQTRQIFRRADTCKNTGDALLKNAVFPLCASAFALQKALGQSPPQAQRTHARARGVRAGWLCRQASMAPPANSLNLDATLIDNSTPGAAQPQPQPQPKPQQVGPSSE